VLQWYKVCRPRITEKVDNRLQLNFAWNYGREYFWRAQCGNSARWDLCGGDWVTGNPTATVKLG
jgi:nicotinamide riboside kinase